MVEAGVIERALSSSEWRSAADALFQASGMAVSVVDVGGSRVLYGGARCSFCSLPSDIEGAGSVSCFDPWPTKLPSGPSRVTCRAGSVTHMAPIVVQGVTVAWVVATGFVASTRERRRLFENLLARGMAQDSARLSVKNIPVVSRREAESFVQIAVAVAEASIVAVAERDIAECRERDARVMERIGSRLAFMDVTDSSMLGGILAESITKAQASAGAVLVPDGEELEVAAIGGEWKGALGVHVPYRATASGRAAATRHAVIVPAEKPGGQSTLAAPIIHGNRVLGVLELRLPGVLDDLDPARQRKLDGFVRLLATILERRRAKEQADRQIAGILELDEYAASLARITDARRVEEFAIDVLGKSFLADAVGLSVSSWERDAARVAVSGTLSHAEVEHAVELALGRDLKREPLTDGLQVSWHGDPLGSDEVRTDLRVLAAPIEAGDLVVGFCFLAGVGNRSFDSQDHTLLERLGRHTGAALERSELLSRLRDDYVQTIAALSVTLDATEHFDTGHTRRVMDYALMIAEEIGLTLEQYEQLRFAGVLHDVGKAGLSRDLLLKPAPLTPDEYAEIKTHAEVGAGVVEQIEFLKALTPIILHHHERWDGKGYPEGLKENEIPLLARVLAVADAFEAMTSERPFRSALTFAAAREELEAGAGTQFDPRLTAALLRALDREVLAGGTGLLAPKGSKGRQDMPA